MRTSLVEPARERKVTILASNDRCDIYHCHNLAFAGRNRTESDRLAPLIPAGVVQWPCRDHLEARPRVPTETAAAVRDLADEKQQHRSGSPPAPPLPEPSRPDPSVSERRGATSPAKGK